MINCNPAYAKMLGYTRKELHGIPVKQLLPEKWHAQREKIASKVIETGRSILFEREYRRKDGSIFPASVRTWRLTDGKGKVIGMWSIVREISLQKQQQRSLEEHAGVLERIVQDREKQLKDAERLVAIGQTAGMVGHDLRNPLQALTGELYLSKNDVATLPAGEAKANLEESIRVMEDQILYMDKIVSDLQAFVQPIHIDKKTFGLEELLSGVMQSVPIPSGVTVRLENKGGAIQVRVDPQLLKRVLINLVTNAVQAMPNGGRLYMVSKVDSSGHVSISVEDTGVGIPDRIRSQIFTPLFTTKPRGQGFGLAVCKRVIEAHGGTISFESAEGKGSRFTVAFPSA
jgi:PAS domain S-box-containing protein